jgi:hypothetical protein
MCQITYGEGTVSISLGHQLALIALASGALCSRWGGCITQLRIAVTPNVQEESRTIKRITQHHHISDVPVSHLIEYMDIGLHHMPDF